MNKWRKPFSILTVIAVVAVSGVTWLMSVAHAAGGQMYTTLGATTVNPGGTVTVNVRINPATPTDTVNVVLAYDTSKMTFANADYSGSPFTQQFGFSSSGGHVSFAAAILGSSVSADSQIAKITFTAATGSAGVGTASFSLAGSNAAYAGNPTNPSIAADTAVTFVCPSGQSGTPPNCSNPSPSPSPSPTPSPSPSPSPSPTPSPSPKPGSGGSSHSSGGGTGSTSVNQTAPIGTPATVTGQTIQYTKASINFTTQTASTAYIRYGIDGNLTSTTPVSPSDTKHSVALDPSTLLPGQTYSYVVVTTDASGHVSQTASQTFRTKGIQVTLTVVDSNHKPIKGKSVTLHSDPITAKTDDKGNVTFADVPLGMHQVVYTAGKKSYTQQITVVNNIVTSGDTQSSAPQTFSVVYGFAQSSLPMVWIWLAVAVLVVATVVVLAQTGRLGFAMQMHNHNYATPLSSPVVVGSNTTSPHPVGPGTNQNEAERASVQEHLNAIPDPSKPSPGSTVAPKDGSDPNNGQTGGRY